MKRENYKLVEVTWLDTVSDCRWQDIGEAKQAKPALGKTVGYLLNETDTEFVVAPTINNLGHTSGTTVIPKQWVRQKRVIKGYYYEVNATKN